MFRRRAAILLLLLTGSVASCGGGRQGWRRGEIEQRILIHVENQNFHDATIYAVVRSQRIRLGQVGGHSNGAFQIEDMASELRFVIDLLAASHFTTAAIVVSPGDEVQLVIAPDLRSSHVYR